MSRVKTSKNREAAKPRKPTRGRMGIPFVPLDVPKLPDTREAIMANSDRLAAELQALDRKHLSPAAQAHANTEILKDARADMSRRSAPRGVRRLTRTV